MPETRTRQAFTPTLATARLTLRPFAAADAAQVQRLAGDPAIADTTRGVPHPYPDGLAASWIASQAAARAAGTAITLAITRTLDAALLGSISLLDIAPCEQAELGFWVGRAFWNQGICTEAGRAMLNYAFADLSLGCVTAHHLARNPASGRVLRKLGMRHADSRRGLPWKHGLPEDVEFYRILVGEFTAP